MYGAGSVLSKVAGGSLLEWEPFPESFVTSTSASKGQNITTYEPINLKMQ